MNFNDIFHQIGLVIDTQNYSFEETPSAYSVYL